MVYEPRNATLTAVDVVPAARDVGVAVIVIGGVCSNPPVVTPVVTVELKDDAGDGDGAGADVHDAFTFTFQRTHGEQGARGVRYVQRSKAVGAQGRRVGVRVRVRVRVRVCVCVL